MTPAISMSAFQLAIRAAVGAALALAVAQGLALEFPLYAMIAAVIVTDLSPVRTRELALPRLAGTVLGCVLGGLFSMVLRPGPLAVGAAILVTMIVTHALRFDSAARLAAYVCGIVILDHRGEPWTYALLRFLETVIGIVAASALSFVPKLLPIRDLMRRGAPKDAAASGGAKQERAAGQDADCGAGNVHTTGDKRHA